MVVFAGPTFKRLLGSEAGVGVLLWTPTPCALEKVSKLKNKEKTASRADSEVLSVKGLNESRSASHGTAFLT